MSGEALVKKAYEAYAGYQNWAGRNGLPLTRWEDLRPRQKGAFAAFALEIVAELAR